MARPTALQTSRTHRPAETPSFGLVFGVALPRSHSILRFGGLFPPLCTSTSPHPLAGGSRSASCWAARDPPTPPCGAPCLSFPFWEGLEEPEAPKGACKGASAPSSPWLRPPGIQIWDPPSIVAAGNTPGGLSMGEPPARLQLGGGIGQGTSLKTGLLLYKF